MKYIITALVGIALAVIQINVDNYRLSSVKTAYVDIKYKSGETEDMLIQYNEYAGLNLDSEGKIFTWRYCAFIFKCRSDLVENVLFFDIKKIH